MMSDVTDAAGLENAETPLVLAIDVGTSSVRAALYDERGMEISGAESRLERSLRTTLDGGSEEEAERSVEHVALAIDALLARAPALASRTQAVAISCFWHSLVGIDSEGRAVTPVFGWADSRAARWTEEMRRRFDESAAHDRTGCRFHSSYWPARLLWLREERAGVYRAARRWMSFGEFLLFRFFGSIEASVSLASGTGLLNVRSCDWDAELLAGLEVAVDQLPEIAPARRSFEGLKKDYARRWPALNGARWFPAIGDGAANNIGEVSVTRASVALMVGTSGAMRVLWRGEPPEHLPSALWCYRADRERVITGGALSDGGGLYAWMKEALRLGPDDEAMMLELAAMEADAHGLTMLPFWAGERSPGWAMHARGAILGLSMHTRPLEILRAAMEAVAYRFALINRALAPFAPDALVVASGGALLASPVWTQIIADALGRPLKLSGLKEASSRGAVLLALEATGKISDIEDAPAPLAEVYEPDMARHERYLSGLERQQKVYNHLIADQGIAESIYEAAASGAHREERRPGLINQNEETKKA